MKSFLNYDSPFMTKANLLADCLFVNLLFVLLCLPIITIGPACAALSHVSFSYLEDKPAGVKCFLSAFWENLRTFLLPWLVVLVAAVMVCFSAYILYAYPIGGILQIVFCCVLVLLILVLAFMLSQLFFVQAKFVCSFRYRFTNSVLIALAHPLRSLLILVLRSLPWILFFCYPYAFAFLTPVWLFFYFSLANRFAAKLMHKVYLRLAENHMQQNDDKWDKSTRK